MKKIILIALFSVGLISLFAQGRQKVKKPNIRYYPWDTLRYKNEFSLDIKPVFLALFAASPATSQWEFGYTYRRFFDKRNALRIGNRFQLYNYSYNFSDLYQYYFSSFRSDQLPIGSSDLIDLSESRFNSEIDLNLRLGYEHRFGKKRVKFILGLDVINGVSFQNLDLNFTQAIIRRLNNQDYLLTPLPEVYISENNIFYKVGLSPIVGMNIHISKRFSFNAAVTPEVSWLFPIKQQNSQYKTGNLKLNALAIISDLSFTVHF